ncbi:MAG TPA: glycoside hydrolase family 9 protein [Rhodothermales bacterium]|nr:glycoside hydrolase family 9 protein [Rhodothermales bacterium]
MFALISAPVPVLAQKLPDFHLNDREYFERGGVNVMAFQDIYPEGHQSGVSVIQHGVRLATGGDLRLEPTPGQWQPVPKQGERTVDQEADEITTRLSYPDPDKDRKGFNPIVYPDLDLAYTVRVQAAGEAVRVIVDLDEPLPAAWVGKVGFNMELFPAALFGKSWYLDDHFGLFPRQPNGPVEYDAEGEIQPIPMATGQRMTVAPENDMLRLHIESLTGDLYLYDGRNKHNNGWFVVRSLVPGDVTKGAIEWIVRPHALPDWRYGPVVQVSQVGYHPDQKKVAVIELDARDAGDGTIRLLRLSPEGEHEEVLSRTPTPWAGTFLRYDYRHFDFSEVTTPGMYVIEYRGTRTEPFQISSDVFERDAWQPTVDYFLPVQMCHMRVEQQYRVWHGLCHEDDALMAPVDTNHFDGYRQGPATMTPFAPGEHVPGLNVGGWHDAGDDDLRIESQADEVHVLASMYELFDLDYDNTRIDQGEKLVQIHQPDGQPDLLQQVEHGILSILGGYRSLGRLYRGIIVPTNQQYVLLGDWANQTDNRIYDPTDPQAAVKDDRMVFTEQHAGHEYKGIVALAIAGRVLRDYNPELAEESTAAAEALWLHERDAERGFNDRIAAAVELLLTTQKPIYRQALLDAQEQIVERIGAVGWTLGRALPLMQDATFEEAVRAAVTTHFATVQAEQEKNPYGVPYEPYIWGAGWGIQEFGMEQYFLHRGFPEIVSADYFLNALNFVLGVHPGSNTASFASGVGANSITTGYGFNRADWSYIPGGVVSGTALIRPDFPELKDFPYLWQQAEYVMGGGATHYMFLVLAADAVLNP